MDGEKQKDWIFEPIDKAPKEVQSIIRKVLSLEKDALATKQAVTPDQVLKIIKEIVK